MKQSNKYHKILSLFKRNMEGDKKFIIGNWTTPELEYLKVQLNFPIRKPTKKPRRR